MTRSRPAGLLAWKVPPGTRVAVQAERVDEAEVTFRAAALYDPAGGGVTRFPDLGAPEIEDRPFTITIEAQAYFDLVLEMTFLADGEVRVTAKATDADGAVVDEVDAGAPCQFEEVYRGRSNEQSTLTVFVGGAE